MRKLLALDPGVTTGFSIFSWEVQYTYKAVFPLDWGNLSIEDLLPKIASLLEQDCYHVIYENIPLIGVGSLGDSLRKVMGIIHTLAPKATVTNPGVWKTFPSLENLPTPEVEKTTLHQKDAYYIGLWYIITQPPKNSKISLSFLNFQL